jgi:TonB-like protein
MRSALVSFAILAGLVGTAEADAILYGHVTDLVGKPVPDVRVHVLAGGSEEQIVKTDANGDYQVQVDGNKPLSVVVGAGDRFTFRRGQLKDGVRQRLDFELELADGEIIRIMDDKPPTVSPKLSKDIPRVTPPYSEEAVERDAWAKAWLLLDIDESGKVLRVKLVKRPGFDLDEIAVKEAMKLHFDPALDEHGKPMRTKIYWAMEWPSHGWLVEHNGTATKLPYESYEVDPFSANFGNAPSSSVVGSTGIGVAPVTLSNKTLGGVRCAGTGPLNLDERYPVYRDCSKPNFKKAPFLPWLDGTQPIPPEPAQFAKPKEPDLKLSKVSYIPQIAMSAATVAVTVGWIVSLVEFNKYEQRLEKVGAADGPKLTTEAQAQQYGRDVDGFKRWQKLKTIGALAAIGSGGISAFLWLRHQKKSDFSVQPEDDGTGASLLYQRRF